MLLPYRWRSPTICARRLKRKRGAVQRPALRARRPRSREYFDKPSKHENPARGHPLESFLRAPAAASSEDACRSNRDYLQDDNVVFGIDIDSDVRAYRTRVGPVGAFLMRGTQDVMQIALLSLRFRQ